MVRDDNPSQETRLTEIAATTSRMVPPVRPNFRVLSREQWDRQQASDAAEHITTFGWRRERLRSR